MSVLCVLGMVRGAPLTTITLGGNSNNVDTESLIDRILLQLDLVFTDLRQGGSMR